MNTRDAFAFMRVGVVGVGAAPPPVPAAAVAVAAGGVVVDAVLVADLADPFCSECFNGELRINSSKSSSMSSILCGGVIFVDNDPLMLGMWSGCCAMRKLISKSNGLLGGWLFVLKDSERANVLLNCGQAPGECGVFGMRTSLLCKFVSIVHYYDE